MRNQVLALAIGLSLLISPNFAFADVNKKTVAVRKTVRKGYYKRVVYAKTQEQQKVFSFVDAPKPVGTVKPLTGIVVKQEFVPEPSPPPVVQSEPPITQEAELDTESLSPNLSSLS